MKLIKHLVLLLLFCDAIALYCDTIAQPPANFTETDAGTATNPYQIATLANLRWLSETKAVWGHSVGGVSSGIPHFFIQTANIEASETITWNYGRGFAPIGGQWLIEGGDHETRLFIGYYNGQNFIISNLYIYSPTPSGNDPFYAPDRYLHIGMFGKIYLSTLQNMRLENASINGTCNSSGLLCGEANDSTILNCFVSGSNNIISYATNQLGGLVGLLNCSIVEYCGSEIYNDVNGCLIGTVRKAEWNVPHSSGRASKVINSYGRGCSQQDNSGLFAVVREDAVINNVYVTNSSTELNTNRLSSYLTSSTFTNSFWDTETTEVTEPFAYIIGDCSISNINGLSTAAMKNAENYIASGWDFESIWAIDPAINDGYPHLRYETIAQMLDISDKTLEPATSLILSNYPNPFNPETTIKFSLAKDSNVTLEIYNVKGQLVRSLVTGKYRAGTHQVFWNGKDDTGQAVSSGIYFYTLITDKATATKKMILLK